MHKKVWFNGYIALSTFIFFMIFLIVILPNEAQKSDALGLMTSPDTSFFYTKQTLYEIAHAYGFIGRSFYIKQRFTFDLVWPLVYGSFLFINSVYLYQKNQFSKYRILLLLPLVAVVFDYLENIMASIVMYRYPSETMIVADLAGFMTALKWLSLSLSFIIIVVLFSMALLRFVRNKMMHR